MRRSRWQRGCLVRERSGERTLKRVGSRACRHSRLSLGRVLHLPPPDLAGIRVLPPRRCPAVRPARPRARAPAGRPAPAPADPVRRRAPPGGQLSDRALSRGQMATSSARERMECIGDDLAEAIANRVTKLLVDQQHAAYLTTAGVARMLAASNEWVREHAGELGAVRLGDGPRGALRFDPARVRAALERRRVGKSQAPRHSRPGPQRRYSDVALLPLPDANGRS
jgi:hypothetical protein